MHTESILRLKCEFVKVPKNAFWDIMTMLEAKMSSGWPLGPVTPPPILLSQSQNDLWTIHIKNLKSLSQYLNTVWPASSLKLDQF